MRAATAETDVVVGATLDVELPRVIKGPGIAIGGDMPHHHLVTSGDLHVADGEIAHRLTTEVHHGRSPAHYFVDGCAHVAVGVGSELGPLVGEVEEGEHPPGDGVAGGLVAGHAQDQKEHVELEFGELLAVYVGGQQSGHDVVCGAAAALGLQGVGVAEQLDRGFFDVVVAGYEVGVLAPDEGVGPLEDV